MRQINWVINPDNSVGVGPHDMPNGVVSVPVFVGTPTENGHAATKAYVDDVTGDVGRDVTALRVDMLAAQEDITDLETAMTSVQGDLSRLSYGTYTPTVTTSTNLSGITAQTASYIKQANIVKVMGRINCTTTLVASTDITLSVPLAAHTDNIITGTAHLTLGLLASVIASGAEPLIKWIAVGAGAAAVLDYEFSYISA